MIARMLLATSWRPHLITSAPAVIVAPHPDDDILGCGGLIALKRRIGASVKVLFLTDGSEGFAAAERASQFPLDDTYTTCSVKGALIETRRREALAALGQLDVHSDCVHFWNLPDGTLSELPNERRKVAGIELGSHIVPGTSTEVYVTHARDGHPDHEAAFQIVLEALRLKGPQVRLFEYPIWLFWSRPFFFRIGLRDIVRTRSLCLGDVVWAKRRAISFHTSQRSRLPRAFLGATLGKREIYFERTVRRDERISNDCAASLGGNWP